MPPKKKTTGELIRAARLAAGYTQVTAAVAIKTHLSLIGDHERGTRIPRPATLQRYADAYRVPVDQLQGSDYDQAAG